MSVFKVRLNNNVAGRLDKDPSTASPDMRGTPFTESIQRTVYVMGPRKINRLLRDGETFTDCNYWLRFAPVSQGGLASEEDSFIEVVSNDGSVYSDIPSENTFPVVFRPGTDGVIAAGETWDDTNMALDILGTYNGHAVFVQISNLDSSNDVQVRLNGSVDAVFTVEGGSSQIFNAGDLSVTKLEFNNPSSGSEIDRVEVIISVRSICNS